MNGEPQGRFYVFPVQSIKSVYGAESVAGFDSIMFYCSKHYFELFYHCQFTAIIELKEVKLPPEMMFSMAI